MRRVLLVVCICSLLLALAGCGGSGSPDFGLAFSPTSATLAPGGSTNVSLAVGAVGGSQGGVGVVLTGLPTGVTANPSSFTTSIGTAQQITLTAAASAGAATATLTATGTSGTKSHSASLALTVAAPPDFSLSVTPPALLVVAGSNGESVAVNATGANGFGGAVAVTLSGLPPGVTASPATLTLNPGTPQNVTFSAPASTAAETGTVTFTGTSGSLKHTATLALAVAGPPVPPPTATPDVTTYHYDTMRTGLNAKETVLMPANVNAAGFGKIGFDAVDGKVDAQPLYLAGVSIGGQMHNVLYVATEHGSLYAFDADNGRQLWQVSTLAAGETPSDDHGCNQITPEIGITSTPVIDRQLGADGTIFLVAMSKDAAGNYHQRLHALDPTTGAEMQGSPMEIQATYPGTGVTSQNGVNTFDPAQYAERAGLLLLNGNIYLGWTSHCDQGAYTGWLMAYSEKTLQQTAVLNLTPNGSDGSIWMSGAGLAADSSGYIYLLDANGTFDTTLDANGFPIHQDVGNSFLKISTANNGLAVADYFEPFNTVAESNADQDLGSGGAMVLPDVPGANGAPLHLAVGAGKDGNVYFVNRDNMGKWNASTNNIYAELPGIFTNGVWSAPAYFNGTVYIGGVSDSVKAFSVAPVSGGSLPISGTPTSTTATRFGYPGSTPSVSANGTTNGIVWALESGLNNPGVLHAYDATDLSKELYNSTQAANGRDAFGNGNKFITPMVVNGKVYVGTQNGVAVFGLLPSATTP